jgi:hypothetical protein
VFSASKDQISCNLEGEAVILNLSRGIYFGLNPVGARIWELLQQPRTIPDIRDTLLAEFEVDSGRCEQDIRALLDQLASKGLVQTSMAAE